METVTTLDLATPHPPSICLFGLDDAGKPHASRFNGADTDRVTKAAALMGLHVLALASPDSGDLAERLPQGRIFETSGKAFVPFVARPLYERLAALGGIPLPPPAPKPEKSPEARQGATGGRTEQAGEAGRQGGEAGGRERILVGEGRGEWGTARLAADPRGQPGPGDDRRRCRGLVRERRRRSQGRRPDGAAMARLRRRGAVPAPP